jgi:hypothetical protein
VSFLDYTIIYLPVVVVCPGFVTSTEGVPVEPCVVVPFGNTAAAIVVVTDVVEAVVVVVVEAVDIFRWEGGI